MNRIIFFMICISFILRPSYLFSEEGHGGEKASEEKKEEGAKEEKPKKEEGHKETLQKDSAEAGLEGDEKEKVKKKRLRLSEYEVPPKENSGEKIISPEEKKINDLVVEKLKKMSSKNLANYSTSLINKEEELKYKESLLLKREEQLKLSEEVMKKKLEEVQKKQKDLINIMENNDQDKEKRVLYMVEVMSKMRPQKAAELLSVQEPDLAVRILTKMPEQVTAKILNLMDKEISARLQKQFLNMTK